MKNGRMTVNEKGAEIVRLIFHKFANEGKGTHIIARELLIELYIGGNIDKEEFTALRTKYDKGIEKMRAIAEGTEKQQGLLSDIKNAVIELVNRIMYEDEFYSELLDKIVVNNTEHINI